MKSFIIATSALLFAVMPSFGQQQSLKLVVIEMERVFSEYYKTKEGEAAINKDKADFEKELSERTAKLKDLIAEAKNLQAAMNDPSTTPQGKISIQQRLQQKGQEAESMRRETQEWNNRRQRQIQNAITAMRKGIIDEIQALVTQMSTDNGYDLVFDMSGQPPARVPLVIFASAKVSNISDLVLAELNKDAPKEATADTGAN